MLFIKIVNIELIGGHIEIMLFKEMVKSRINRRPH